MDAGKRGGLVTQAIVLVDDALLHAKLVPEGLRYLADEANGAAKHPAALPHMVDSLLRSLPNPAVWPYYANKLARLYQGPMNTGQRIAAIMAGLMHAVEDALQDQFTATVREAWQLVCKHVQAYCCLCLHRESLYVACVATA